MIIFAYYSSTESYFHFVLFGRITFVLIWLCDGVRACVFLLSPSLLCTVAIRDCEWPIAGCECMLVCVCVYCSIRRQAGKTAYQYWDYTYCVLYSFLFLIFAFALYSCHYILPLLLLLLLLLDLFERVRIRQNLVC